MQIRGFIQNEGVPSTLDQMERLFDYVKPERALFCFAYGTLSGCVEFHRRLGDGFWASVSSQWLIGIDYGRTQPSALEFISEKDNTEVRVLNGSAVVKAEGFFPEQDFHMKACFVRNERLARFGMLVGSGNFSRNGLVQSIECGIALTAKNSDEYNKILKAPFGQAKTLWKAAEPLHDVFATYKALWKPGNIDDGTESEPEEEQVDFGNYERFWIDVGYVTRNRGPQRPGNQIDMPRGVHSFFGLIEPANLTKNTRLGNVTFIVGGTALTRSLRLGNNFMEKITLPFPEDYGIGAYDGKIIEFRRLPNGFALRAFEIEEYGRLLNRGPRGITKEMGSGRLYGFR